MGLGLGPLVVGPLSEVYVVRLRSHSELRELTISKLWKEYHIQNIIRWFLCIHLAHSVCT